MRTAQELQSGLRSSARYAVSRRHSRQYGLSPSGFPVGDADAGALRRARQEYGRARRIARLGLPY